MGVMRDALVRSLIALELAIDEYQDEGDIQAWAEISSWLCKDSLHICGHPDGYKSLEKKLLRRKRTKPKWLTGELTVSEAYTSDPTYYIGGRDVSPEAFKAAKVRRR